MSPNCYIIAFNFLLLFTVYAQPPLPPPKPNSFPVPSQLYYIDSEELLNDPLVSTAYDYVLKTVNPKILALKPSQQIYLSNVSYPSDQESATKACYWGLKSQCVRDKDTQDFKADITYCPKPYQWGISYDDGPNTETIPGTPEVRKALADNNIKATFFVLGSSAYLFPNELKNLLADGHQIAIHTWTHHPMTNLTNRQIVAELKYTERIIYDTIGVLPIYFRPPFGDIDDRVRAIVSSLGYRTVIWTSVNDFVRDTLDTDSGNQALGIPTIVANISKWFNATVNQKQGFVSLEHDVSQFTANLSVNILAAFKKSSSLLKPQPVGMCREDAFYRLNNTITPSKNDEDDDEPEWWKTPVVIGVSCAVAAISITFVSFLLFQAVNERKRKANPDGSLKKVAWKSRSNNSKSFVSPDIENRETNPLTSSNLLVPPRAL
ncbi:chitin deacetylase [Nowakowskiella sp. JEL0078]|nr:chitin deacetylase [Nowakowskiella sp. JEL0078]